MNEPSRHAKNSLSGRSKDAHAKLEQAFSLHLQRNKAGALKTLRQALKLDPALAKEAYTSNLAREITGLPEREALKSILDEDAGKKLMDAARKERQKAPSMRHQRILFPLLAILTAVFIGLCAWTISSGGFDPYLSAIRITRLLNQKSSLGGYDYYVAIPGGSAPENGWPMVAAFHGYGGDGRHMLSLAETYNDAGAIFVAPTLGTYEPNPGDGPLEPVNRILTELGKQYPLQSRGAILLGVSQGGSFAYRFSVYYPDKVAGVVTAGTPELDPIFPSRNIPYIFTWGELDGLQEFVMPLVFPIQKRGFNVRTAIIPDVGHELSQYAVDQVLILLEQP